MQYRTHTSNVMSAANFSMFGVYKKVMNEMFTPKQLIEYKLPKIIVVGDESVGKSSLIERITKFPVFPKNSSMCTRCPIRVTMAKGPKLYKVSIDGEDIIIDEKEQIRDLITKHMLSLPGVCEDEITVTIQEPETDEFEFIDLPGIRNGFNGVESRKVTRRYLKDKNTIVLCTVSMSTDSIANSNIIPLIKKMNMEKQTILVFTKLDEALYNKKDLIEKRLTGSDIDVQYSGFIHSVGVYNRISDTHTLEEWDSIEEKFVKENLLKDQSFSQQTRELFQNRTTLAKLLIFIDDLYNEFIKTEWKPRVLKHISKKIKNINISVNEMGKTDINLIDMLGINHHIAKHFNTVIPKIQKKLEEYFKKNFSDRYVEISERKYKDTELKDLFDIIRSQLQNLDNSDSDVIDTDTASEIIKRQSTVYEMVKIIQEYKSNLLKYIRSLEEKIEKNKIDGSKAIMTPMMEQNIVEKFFSQQAFEMSYNSVYMKGHLYAKFNFDDIFTVMVDILKSEVRECIKSLFENTIDEPYNLERFELLRTHIEYSVSSKLNTLLLKETARAKTLHEGHLVEILHRDKAVGWVDVYKYSTDMFLMMFAYPVCSVDNVVCTDLSLLVESHTYVKKRKDMSLEREELQKHRRFIESLDRSMVLDTAKWTEFTNQHMEQRLDSDNNMSGYHETRQGQDAEQSNVKCSVDNIEMNLTQFNDLIVESQLIDDTSSVDVDSYTDNTVESKNDNTCDISDATTVDIEESETSVTVNPDVISIDDNVENLHDDTVTIGSDNMMDNSNELDSIGDRYVYDDTDLIKTSDIIEVVEHSNKSNSTNEESDGENWIFKRIMSTNSPYLFFGSGRR